MGGGYPSGPTPPTGLEALGLPKATIQAFTSALQDVVAVGVVADLTSPSPIVTVGKVATLSLLHLRFVCGVEGYGDLPPIWEVVARGEFRTEGLDNLNQVMMRGLLYCCRFFGGRVHFSASLPLLELVNNVSLWSPSLEPACTGGGGSPCV